MQQIAVLDENANKYHLANCVVALHCPFTSWLYLPLVPQIQCFHTNIPPNCVVWLGTAFCGLWLIYGLIIQKQLAWLKEKIFVFWFLFSAEIHKHITYWEPHTPKCASYYLLQQDVEYFNHDPILNWYFLVLFFSSYHCHVGCGNSATTLYYEHTFQSLSFQSKYCLSIIL